MTNPHTTTPTDIDIRRSADAVIAQLRQGQNAEAMRSLEQARADERPVVQEALDRYVSAGARTELNQLHASRAMEASPENSAALQRLRDASNAPRMPAYSQTAGAPNELVGLTEAQKYDVYASMVETRGNQNARDALGNQESVLLGLRKETSSVASADAAGDRGTGVYDDQIAVLRKEADGTRHMFVTERANTEPTAQYDAHAKPQPGRENTPYANVSWRRTEGVDVNGDRIADAGRMAEGTIEMTSADHANPASAGTNAAFRPSPEQLAPARVQNMIERDTNGDGRFDENDTHRLQDLDRTFKIHSGSRTNTDSAGCQTIHPGDYQTFMNAATANANQTRWQYVLTSTDEGRVQEQGQEQGQPGQQQGQGQNAPQRQQQPPPANAAPAGQRHGMNQQTSGPFNDATADRYFAAAMSGDSDALDRLAQQYAQSAEGQQSAQWGNDLLAQQQASEQQLAHQQRMPQEQARQM